MPFLAQEHVPIPTTDLLSWMLDSPKYDVDEPVRTLPDDIMVHVLMTDMPDVYRRSETIEVDFP